MGNLSPFIHMQKYEWVFIQSKERRVLVVPSFAHSLKIKNMEHLIKDLTEKGYIISFHPDYAIKGTTRIKLSKASDPNYVYDTQVLPLRSPFTWDMVFTALTDKWIKLYG